MKTNSAFKGMLAGVAMVLGLTACSGQNGNTALLSAAGSALAIDTPEVSVKVNKQYDEKGNLIAYDSTYTSIYHGNVGNTVFMDSVFKDFTPWFGTRYPFLNDPGFNDLFFQDSLYHHDFFHHDFFRKRMELNHRYMQRMMAEMDSVKNSYLHDRSQPKDSMH